MAGGNNITTNNWVSGMKKKTRSWKIWLGIVHGAQKVGGNIKQPHQLGMEGGKKKKTMRVPRLMQQGLKRVKSKGGNRKTWMGLNSQVKTYPTTVTHQ